MKMRINWGYVVYWLITATGITAYATLILTALTYHLNWLVGLIIVFTLAAIILTACLEEV